MNRKNIGDLIDTNLTLEQLENEFWGKAPQGASRLIAKCHELRGKKVGDFETEDFRLLIGQNLGLPFLVPLSIEILRKNAFVEGDYYEGDLLHNILKSKGEFWKDNPDLKREVVEIFENNRMRLQQLDVSQEIKEGLLEAFDEFIKN